MSNTATLEMPTEEAQRKVIKIMYRKRKATKEDIEASFRRSVDSAGKSVAKTLNAALKKLQDHGNLKLDGRNGKYAFKNGRIA